MTARELAEAMEGLLVLGLLECDDSGAVTRYWPTPPSGTRYVSAALREAAAEPLAPPELVTACRDVIHAIDCVAANWPEQAGILATLHDERQALEAALAASGWTS